MDFLVKNMGKLKLDHNDGIVSSVTSPLHKLLIILLKCFHRFLNWLFSKETQQDMPGQGRTFRRQIADFWQIWPMPPKIETSRDVVFVDGIYLAKKLVF